MYLGLVVYLAVPSHVTEVLFQDLCRREICGWWW